MGQNRPSSEVQAAQNMVVRTKTNQGSSGNLLAQISNLKVSAVLSGGTMPDLTSAVLRNVEKRMSARLGLRNLEEGFNRDARTKQGLPATLELAVNGFRSQQLGGYIFNVTLNLKRPVNVLGTTEVGEAIVWTVALAARCDRDRLESWINSNADDLIDLCKTEIARVR